MFAVARRAAASQLRAACRRSAARRGLCSGGGKEGGSQRPADKPVVRPATLAGGVLLASVAASVGSLYLVSQDGQEQVTQRGYLSMPQVHT